MIPQNVRSRRSSHLMHRDPITLVIALGESGSAEGSLHVDGGETFDYESRARMFTSYVFDKVSSTLTSRDMPAAGVMIGGSENKYSLCARVRLC